MNRRKFLQTLACIGVVPVAAASVAPVVAASVPKAKTNVGIGTPVSGTIEWRVGGEDATWETSRPIKPGYLTHVNFDMPQFSFRHDPDTGEWDKQADLGVSTDNA